ncbi:MAG: amino acid deaminase/aldolase, partial [Thermoleophilaceae bacterium]|nr:amino acid deaminase/aldolase [Thermoleophilaceae bacterium]
MESATTPIQPSSASLNSSARYAHYNEIFANTAAPFAFVDLDAMWSNSDEMLARAHGKPIRVASKSLRCAPLQRLIFERNEQYQGLLTFTLPETLWLHEQGFENLVLAYPSVDREALAALARVTAASPATAPTVVVDCVEHLDLIDSAADASAPIRVCIEVDAGYRTLGGRVKIGPKRSPIYLPEDAAAIARAAQVRAGTKVVGMMLYEGQTAGVGDDVPGQALKNAVIRRLQKASASELAERRARAVEAVSAVGPLEFVNGGGTGSLHLTGREPAVTELAAGSGFYAPALFDNYQAFSLAPAAMFALPVVRKPTPNVATALGGGYLASGPGAKDRMPTPYLPSGLKLDSLEGTGEVQTPLHGPPAAQLKIGDHVYFRHVKAGELCERFNSLLLVQGGKIVDEVA